MKVIIAFKHKLSNKFLERAKQKIIQKWTKSPYYHVEIIIGNTWIEADNSIGLVKHELRPLSDKYHYLEIDVFECDHTQKLVDSFIESQMGANYDWTGIFLSQVIKLGIDKKDSCIGFKLSIQYLYKNNKPNLFLVN